MRLLRILAAFALLSAPIDADLLVAQCSEIGPSISLSTMEGATGSQVVVTGTRFKGAVFCGVDGPPAKDIKISLVQGESKKEIVRINAEKNLTFSIKVTIPNDASVGDASLRAEANFSTAMMKFKIVKK